MRSSSRVRVPRGRGARTAGAAALAALISSCIFGPGAVQAVTASSAAALKTNSTLAGHDHGSAAESYHAEFQVGSKSTRLKLVLVDVGICGEQAVFEGVDIGPDGMFVISKDFEATDAKTKKAQTGHLELAGRVVSSTRIEGSFHMTEPGCDSNVRAFVAEPDAGDDGHAGHDHGTTTTGTGTTHNHSVAGHTGHIPANPSAATPAQRAQATRLWNEAKQVAKTKFRTYDSVLGQGFVRHATTVKAGMTFHVEDCHSWVDGKLMNAQRPESLVYWRVKGRAPVLVGFMFRAPFGHRPKFAGPMLSWHQHAGPTPSSQKTAMTHVWLTENLEDAFAEKAPLAALRSYMLKTDAAASASPPSASAANHLRYTSQGSCVPK